jgi:glutathione S-transferase
MYTLYYSPGTASLCVHWLLLELGVEFEAKRVDIESGEQKSPGYLALNPNGRVPTLVIDGRPTYEAAALVLLLAERHPQSSFAPRVGTPERSAYLQWTLHFANTLQPAFRNWFYSDEAAGAENAEATRGCARAAIESAWDRVAAQLDNAGPYLCGDAITAADFLTTMLMRWSRNMPKPATTWPTLDAYVRRMKSRPTFRTLYEREGLTEWA